MLECTVYPKIYAHGFVVLCFVVVMQSSIMNSHQYLSIFIRVALLALEQSIDCQRASEASLMDMGKSMYNHNKAQQSKKRVHISWDILYAYDIGKSYSYSPGGFIRPETNKHRHSEVQAPKINNRTPPYGLKKALSSSHWREIYNHYTQGKQGINRYILVYDGNAVH